MPRNLLPLLALILALPAAAQEAAKAPALDALRAGAANPDCAMGGVTGEACPSTDAAVVESSTAAARVEAAQPAIAHREETVVPSPSPIKAKVGSFVHGVGDYFSSDGVREGVAFGAAIGMLLLAASPVGIVGGALIGAAVGAVICGGLIQKVWHHFFH